MVARASANLLRVAPRWHRKSGVFQRDALSRSPAVIPPKPQAGLGPRGDQQLGQAIGDLEAQETADTSAIAELEREGVGVDLPAHPPER